AGPGGGGEGPQRGPDRPGVWSVSDGELWAYAGRLADVPIGPLVADPADWNWCGRDWTAWAPISATSGHAVGTDAGIFRISEGDGTLICVGCRVVGVARAPSGARVKGHVDGGG